MFRGAVVKLVKREEFQKAFLEMLISQRGYGKQVWRKLG
jgi:hypothetical protein